MNEDRALVLYDAITAVREEYLEEAAAPCRKVRRWGVWAAAAACLFLLIGGWSFLQPLGFAISNPFLRAGGATGGKGGQALESYQYYAGPVLPLAAGEDGLTAERQVDFDFCRYDPERAEAGGYYADFLDRQSCQVTDAYLLRAEEAGTYTLYYPFTASLSDSMALLPTVTVNGEARSVASAIGSDQIYTENGIDYYWVKVEGIAAKDADTEFTFSLVCNYNGETITDTYTDSVKAALTQAAAENAGSAFADAANAALAYCKAAAEAFGKTSSVTFAPVADVTTYAPIAEFTAGSGAIELCGTSILLKDELAIKFWARRGSYTGSLETLTVKVNGVAVAAEKAENGAYLTFKISVPVSEAKTAMTVELFANGASVSNRYTDSVLNYALSMTGESAALGQAIVNYIHYSNEYLATLAA